MEYKGAIKKMRCEQEKNNTPSVDIAYAMAIEAMEKQIPKKPTSIDYKKYIDTVKNALYLKGAYWCPNCEHVVKCGTYCRDCGQAIDWSEAE